MARKLRYDDESMRKGAPGNSPRSGSTWSKVESMSKPGNWMTAIELPGLSEKRTWRFNPCGRGRLREVT
jgi:hypothetical protein